MEEYKWNLKEIRKRKRYVLERFKNTNDIKEKEALSLTFMNYMNMLENSGTIRYTYFYNAINILSHVKIVLKTNSKKIGVNENSIFENKHLFSEDYLVFLINLSNIVSQGFKMEDVKNFETLKLDISNKDIIDISKRFYSKIGDKEIYEKAMKTLNDSSSINFSQAYSKDYEDAGGIMFTDFIFDKAYITVKDSKDVFKTQALNHEVMHAVEFYTKKKLLSENQFGFAEVPTYTVDYLFINYLKEIGFEREANNLEVKKDYYLQFVATNTLLKLRALSISKNGLSSMQNSKYENYKKIVNFDILKSLLEVESGIIAYGIYLEIEANKEKGLETLKKFMKNNIPIDSKPDFSYLGFSDKYILELARNFSIKTKKTSDTCLKSKL